MSCPKCDYPMYCGCEACSRTPAPYGFKRYTLEQNPKAKFQTLIRCPNCGFVTSEDDWFRIDMEQSKELLSILEQLPARFMSVKLCNWIDNLRRTVYAFCEW